MHLSICNLDIPPPGNPQGNPQGNPPGICIFRFLAPSSKKLFKCPRCKTHWMGKFPTPGPFFSRRLTRQDRFKTIRYKYQMVFFKLKLDKGTSYLHSKASLSSYGPFLVSHSVTNALGVKFPTPPSGSKVKFPTPGEREGVKCPWYAR